MRSAITALRLSNSDSARIATTVSTSLRTAPEATMSSASLRTSGAGDTASDTTLEAVPDAAAEPPDLSGEDGPEEEATPRDALASTFFDTCADVPSTAMDASW